MYTERERKGENSELARRLMRRSVPMIVKPTGNSISRERVKRVQQGSRSVKGRLHGVVRNRSAVAVPGSGSGLVVVHR